MRLLIAIALFVCTAAAWSQNASDKGTKQKLQQTEKTNADTEINKNVANNPPVTITVSPTITTTSKPDQQREQKEDKSSIWEAVAALATVALAFITFGLAYFTLKLWRSTRKLVRSTEQTTKAQERAYVYARPHAPLILRLFNYGKTPAYVDHVSFRAIEFPGEPWEMPKIDDFRVETVLRETIPPGEASPTEVRTPFDMAGDKTLAFYGRVFFRDVFGDNWSTAWAYRLEPKEQWTGYALKGHGSLRYEGRTKDSA